VCADPASETPLASAKLVASSLSPPSPHPVLERTIVADGPTISVRYTENLIADGASVVLGGNVQNKPNPVQLDDGSYGIFVARQDGIVSRIDPFTKTVIWSKSVRRIGCTNDSLSATPSVHLRRYATAAFKAAYSTDLIYVPTRYSACLGSNVQNKVFALRATNGMSEWAFNESNLVQMDIVAESGYLDYASDTLYVASERTYSTTQDSLWAINILTGTKTWSRNVGRMQTIPMVRGDRLYVGTLAGEIKALNRSDGSLIWSVSNRGSPITSNIFAERRAGYKGWIGSIDLFFGQVMMVRDDGLSGTPLWTTTLPGGAMAVGRVAIEPYSRKHGVRSFHATSGNTGSGLSMPQVI